MWVIVLWAAGAVWLGANRPRELERAGTLLGSEA